MIWNKIFTLLSSFAIHSTDHAALTGLPSQTMPIPPVSVKYLSIALRTVKVLTSKCDQCHKASQCHCRASPLTADWINTQLHHSGSQPALKSRNLPHCDWKGFWFSLWTFFWNHSHSLLFMLTVERYAKWSLPVLPGKTLCSDQNSPLWHLCTSLMPSCEQFLKVQKANKDNTSLLLFSETGFLFASF